MSLNGWLSIVVLIGILVFIYFWIRGNNGEDDDGTENTKYTLESMQTFIQDAMLKSITDRRDDYNISEKEYQKRRERQSMLRMALRTCMQGDIRMKNYVKSRIYRVLERTYGLNEQNINQIIPFHRPDLLSDQELYDILIYDLQKEHEIDAFAYMVEKYELGHIKELPDGSKGYRITGEEIRSIYLAEEPQLSFRDKLNIIVQRIYQKYKGLGVIDELRDQNIDGINIGTSGLPTNMALKLRLKDYMEQVNYAIPRAHESVWAFFKGKSINLAFLSFGTEKELMRVCQNIYTHGFPGPLNETTGFKINDMADGSRVVVVRPRLGENWAAFVRKFNDSIVSIENQIKGRNAKDVILLIYYLIRGKRGIAITGAPGSGKTTMLKALCGFISHELNIRVLELAFELFLKKYYLFKNVYTLRETPTVTAQMALDMSKKIDAGVTVLGEVASREVADIAIQIKQSGSEMLMLTGHMNTLDDLIDWFSTATLGTAGGDIQKAEAKVIDALNINIHQVNDQEGRHLERITECVPVTQTELPQEYKKIVDPMGRISAFMDTMTEYFKRRTERKMYTHHNIVEWQNGELVFVHRPSNKMVQEIVKVLAKESKEDAEGFLDLLSRVEWMSEKEGAA